MASESTHSITLPHTRQQGLSQSDDEEDDSVDAAEGSIAVEYGAGKKDGEAGNERGEGKGQGKGEGKGADGVPTTAAGDEDDDVEPLEPPTPPLIEQAMERWNVIGTENLLRYGHLSHLAHFVNCGNEFYPQLAGQPKTHGTVQWTRVCWWLCWKTVVTSPRRYTPSICDG